jgi:hypothetical protein
MSTFTAPEPPPRGTYCCWSTAVVFFLAVCAVNHINCFCCSMTLSFKTTHVYAIDKVTAPSSFVLWCVCVCAVIVHALCFYIFSAWHALDILHYSAFNICAGAFYLDIDGDTLTGTYISSTGAIVDQFYMSKVPSLPISERWWCIVSCWTYWVSCNVTWCDVMWCDVLSYGVIWCDVIW